MRFHINPGKGDRTPLDALNRVFRKVARRAGVSVLPKLHPSRCSIRMVRWTTAELAERVTPFHERSCPCSLDGPLVAVELEGKTHLVDGNTRLNYWVSRHGDRTHDVNVIRPL